MLVLSLYQNKINIQNDRMVELSSEWGGYEGEPRKITKRNSKLMFAHVMERKIRSEIPVTKMKNRSLMDFGKYPEK